MIDLGKFVAEARPEELPALIGELEAARARAWARLTMPAPARADADHLLDMEAVAAALAVPLAHARELGRRGELPIVHVGRYVRVRAGALADWLALRENGRLPRARRT